MLLLALMPLKMYYERSIFGDGGSSISSSTSGFFCNTENFGHSSCHMGKKNTRLFIEQKLSAGHLDKNVLLFVLRIKALNSLKSLIYSCVVVVAMMKLPLLEGILAFSVADIMGALHALT